MTRETQQDLWQRTASTTRPTFVWSIEHILPQGENLPQDWIDMLGGHEQARTTQQELVHHLGNLTITGYNSTLSNASFVKKRDRKDSRGNSIGYRNGLSLNAGLADLDTWGRTEILSRTDERRAGDEGIPARLPGTVSSPVTSFDTGPMLAQPGREMPQGEPPRGASQISRTCPEVSEPDEKMRQTLLNWRHCGILA